MAKFAPDLTGPLVTLTLLAPFVLSWTFDTLTDLHAPTKEILTMTANHTLQSRQRELDAIASGSKKGLAIEVRETPGANFGVTYTIREEATGDVVARPNLSLSQLEAELGQWGLVDGVAVRSLTDRMTTIEDIEASKRSQSS